MIPMTLREITDAVGGSFHGDAALFEATVADIVIDSRLATAGALYILLDFLNTAVAYMFDANAGEIIREKLFVNLIMLAVMAVLTFFLGCIAQFALSIKRQREEPLNVGLPLRLRRK